MRAKGAPEKKYGFSYNDTYQLLSRPDLVTRGGGEFARNSSDIEIT